jgi:lysine-specific demethylase/histidyl-hydroxylase NO66
MMQDTQIAGMSRAAKKRAKKNKKKMEHTTSKASNSVAELGKSFSPKKKARLNENEMASKPPSTSVKKSIALDEEEETNYDLPKFENAPLREIMLLKEAKEERLKEQLHKLTTEQRSAALFQAILDPIPLADFYKEYWEKKPLLVRAKNKQRYEGLLTLESIKEMTKSKTMYYGRDLNVTKYVKDEETGDKRRLTLDTTPQTPEEEDEGVKINPKEIWKNYGQGCTVRLLCPHKQEDKVHTLLSTLESELQCMVGANAYLTPPNSSQGFAPHYDDIEAFCLQLQGSKRWKVYEPTLKLPRTSSEDFSVEEIKELTQVMDVTLEEGDLLYMPRGWIHQACTLKNDDEHSLHLTVSAMQQWAWVDLLDVIMPEALETAAMSETSSSLRQGLPRGFMDYMGAMFEEPNDEKLPESLKKVGAEDEQLKFRKMLQDRFKAEAKKRIMKVAKTVS